MFVDGDRIRLKNHQNGHGKGLSGTLKIRRLGWLIQFDEKQSFAHEGDGTIPFGFAWFVEKGNIETEEVPYDPTQVGDTDEDI